MYLLRILHVCVSLSAEIITLKSAETYQKQRDPTYREKILLRKLALKDQEIQDYAVRFVAMINFSREFMIVIQ